MPSKQQLVRRRYLVKKLFEMGHTMRNIADMLCVSWATVHKDLSLVRADKGDKSVKEPSLLARSIAAILAQRKDEEDLREALYRWRPLAQMEAQAKTIELVYGKLRVGADLPEKYRELINDLIGTVYLPVHDDAYFRKLPEILQMIPVDGIPETENELISWYIRQCEKEMRFSKNEIALCWCPAVIIYTIDQAIASLKPRIQQVINMRYGKKMKLREIGDAIGVGKARVGQIRLHGLAQLRARIDFANIIPRISNVQGKIDQLRDQLSQRTHECIILSKQIKRLQTGAPLSDTDVAEYREHLNVFYRSVNELELSVRAANCLQYLDIVLIGDLVQKSRAELLKRKNFGHKSLKEVISELAEMGLTLGMEGPEIDAFNDWRNK